MFKKILSKLLLFIKNYFVVIYLILLFFASSYALLHHGFFRVHDFTHAARIAEMARALEEGQFPVRWSENFGYGFGMPLFNFYAPLPYFIGAVFFKLGLSVITSVKALYFLINFLTLLGAYLLGKKLFGRWSGLILATAYVLAPYRAVNLFVRGALSEAFAMALIPWVIYGIVAFIKKQNKKYLFILLISLFSIVLSHNLTALIFIPMAALFTFIYLLYLKKMKLLRPIASQFLLALALSAFYALPAVLEKDSTIINGIFSGYFAYSQHFLYVRQFLQENWQYGGSVWGPEDNISFFLGYGQLLALVFLCIFLSRRLVRHGLKKLLGSQLFFLITLTSFFLILSLFMATMKSQFLWDNLAILVYIQFPWRFLSVAAFFIAFLAALMVYLLPDKPWRSLCSVVLLMVLLVNFKYFKPQDYLDNPEVLYYSDAEKIQLQMSETLPDYIPIQMAKEEILQTTSPQVNKIWVDGQEPIAITKETFMVDRSFEKLTTTKFSKETLLNFKIAYFPGWQAEIDGESTQIYVNPELGNIQVLVPPDSHQVAVYFTENTVARKTGDLISFLALITVCYVFYPFAKDKQVNHKS